MEWLPGNFVLHSGDIYATAFLLALGRDAMATMAGDLRTYAKGGVPCRSTLMVGYTVQAIVRYRLNHWVGNNSEVITDFSIDVSTGSVRLHAAALTRVTGGAAQAIAILFAAGFVAPGTTTTPVEYPAGHPNAGDVEISRPLTPAEAGVAAWMANGNQVETLSSETMSLVCLQLSSDGHHFAPDNQVVDTLLTNSVVDWKGLSTALSMAGGGTLAEHQACILHKALHSLDSRVIVAWGSSAASASDLKALGVEAIAVRFPVDTPSGHAASARLSVIVDFVRNSEAIGAKQNLQAITATLTAICGLPHITKSAHESTIAGIVATSDTVGAYAAGYLTGYSEILKSGLPSSAKAKSTTRLMDTHGDTWALGSAQGQSAALAVRAEGTTFARPSDVQYVAVNVPAIDAAVQAQPVAVPHLVPRAPATEGRLRAVKDQHAALMAGFTSQSAVAAATGAPAPPVPAPVDFSGCF